MAAADEGVKRRQSSRLRNQPPTYNATFTCGGCQAVGSTSIPNVMFLSCCENLIHKHCMKEWERHRRSETLLEVECPYCRSVHPLMPNPLPWVAPPPESDMEDESDSDDEEERQPPAVVNSPVTRDALASAPILTRDEIIARLRELLGSPELEARLREVSVFLPLINMQIRELMTTLQLNHRVDEVILILDCASESQLIWRRRALGKLLQLIAKPLSLLLRSFSGINLLPNVAQRECRIWYHLFKLKTKEHSICFSIRNISDHVIDVWDGRFPIAVLRVFNTYDKIPSMFITDFQTDTPFPSTPD